MGIKTSWWGSTMRSIEALGWNGDSERLVTHGFWILGGYSNIERLVTRGFWNIGRVLKY